MSQIKFVPGQPTTEISHSEEHSICQEGLNQPKMVSCCGKSFCADCICRVERDGKPHQRYHQHWMTVTCTRVVPMRRKSVSGLDTVWLFVPISKDSALALSITCACEPI